MYIILVQRLDSLYSAQVTVSGAGTRELNGEYIAVGVDRGRPRFARAAPVWRPHADDGAAGAGGGEAEVHEASAGCCIARSGKLDRARARLYRGQIL